MGFWTSVLDACVRNLGWGLRITISVILFGVCLLMLKWSIRKKDSKHPLALGYFVLCLLSLFLSIAYISI